MKKSRYSKKIKQNESKKIVINLNFQNQDFSSIREAQKNMNQNSIIGISSIMNQSLVGKSYDSSLELSMSKRERDVNQSKDDPSQRGINL